MDFKDLQKNWEGFGKEDPFWAVLTEPDKINNQWNASDFFNTGKHHVNHYLKISGVLENVSKSTALDFGCGPGRLTQPLANHFEEVHGVDISEPMISLANQLNKRKRKVSFHVNTEPNLKLFKDQYFDFIFSLITLQHIQPTYIIQYIQEFCRILKPNGYALFNLPTDAPIYHRILEKTVGNTGINFLRRIYYKKKWIMEIHFLPEKKVKSIIESNGCEIIKTLPSDIGKGWKGLLYIIHKKSNE